MLQLKSIWQNEEQGEEAGVWLCFDDGGQYVNLHIMKITQN